MTPMARAHALHSLDSDPHASLQALGRVLLALLFVVSGVQKVLGFDGVAAWMGSLGLPYASTALGLTIALEVVGGLALALGFRARLLAWALVAFVVVASVVFHAFWSAPAEQFSDQLTHFLKNLAIVGGLILIAGRERR